MGKNYYDLLNVRRDASPAELKRAYEVALSRASRDGATRHMVDLVAAYEVLSHPGRRQVYDSTGVGVVPERVPNTYGRPTAFRGGQLGLGARRRPPAPGVIVPGTRTTTGRAWGKLIVLSVLVGLALGVVAILLTH